MTNDQINDAMSRLKALQAEADSILAPYDKLGIEITVRISTKNFQTIALGNLRAEDLDILVNQCLEAYMPGE